MKGIKTILGALAVASLFVFSSSAFAQENGNRDENGKVVRGAYETNKFWDNWFIGVGAGINEFMAKDAKVKWIGGIAIDANFGKWITPDLGLRLGWKGLNNSFDQSDVVAGGASSWNQNFVHADVLWNMSNTFGGYKETRIWDIEPYVQFGVLLNNPAGKNATDLEYGGGIGFLNDFRLGKHVDLFLDLSTIIARRSAFDAIHGQGDFARFAFLPSATFGIIINFGKSGFDRHTSVTPVVVPVPFTVDEYNALKARVEELEQENAALRDEIEALKNQKPDTVYVGNTGAIESPGYAFFDIGSATLSDREKIHLDFFVDNVANNLPEDKGIVVTGSADKATGSAKRNQQLAEQRAEAVKKYLVKKGVAEDKIETVVLGGIDGAVEARRVTVETK